uniref:Ig-like domain-containing protein n=1 Tax=Anguilla anguilla TaxID=7936 RepID=A0A0E9U1B4_ANGAN
MMLHCLFLLLSTIVGNSFEDAVTPIANAVHALEGSSVMLSCNYTGSANNLQWYRQFPRSKT